MKEKIASIVKEAIHYRDGKEYELIVYTIMPNHIHLVFTPIDNSQNHDNVVRFTESQICKSRFISKKEKFVM